MEEESCDVGLSLGIGSGIGDGKKHNPVQFHVLFPIHPKEEERNQFDQEKRGRRRRRLRSSTTVEAAAEEEEEEEEEDLGCSNGKDGSRKKLRLSKEQSDLLEDNFKKNNTLNLIQKKELAKLLNLRTRQVEVWFQNKRARTKLKQTEVDCEFLKKCCERLSDENQRLKKELIDMRLKMTVGSQTTGSDYMPITKATMKICPSCDKTTGSDGGGDSETTCDIIAVAAVESEPKIGGGTGCYVISCRED